MFFEIRAYHSPIFDWKRTVRFARSNRLIKRSDNIFAYAFHFVYFAHFKKLLREQQESSCESMTAYTLLTKFLAQLPGNRVNTQCYDILDVLPWHAMNNQMKDDSLKSGRANDVQIFGNILAGWSRDVGTTQNITSHGFQCPRITW